MRKYREGMENTKVSSIGFFSCCSRRSMEDRGEKEEGRVSLKLGKRGIGQGVDGRDAFAIYIEPLLNCTGVVEVEERSFNASSRAFSTPLRISPLDFLTRFIDIYFPLQVPGYLWNEE